MVPLTNMEIKIMKLVCKQYMTPEIAVKLGIKKRTLEGYRLNLNKKIKAKTTAGIVIYAIKNGLFKI